MRSYEDRKGGTHASPWCETYLLILWKNTPPYLNTTVLAYFYMWTILHGNGCVKASPNNLTQFMKPNLCVSLPHQRSTTVSLETNPVIYVNIIRVISCCLSPWEWEWTASARDVHQSRPVHGQLVLPDQSSMQGFLEAPTLKALVPTGSDPGQTCCHQERSTHTLLPQPRLRHRPLLGVLLDQAATEEVPRY